MCLNKAEEVLPAASRARTYDFYEDPGHGWLKVPRKDIKKLGIEDQVSGYSYQRGDMVYLEEDCDETLFEKAMAATGVEVRRRWHVANQPSRIRGYACFSPQS